MGSDTARNHDHAPPRSGGQHNLRHVADALDARHSSALAPALGATPRQVTAALSVAQVDSGARRHAARYSRWHRTRLHRLCAGATSRPPLWQLLAVVPVTALAVAALTAVPARLRHARPAAAMLQAELA